MLIDYNKRFTISIPFLLIVLVLFFGGSLYLLGGIKFNFQEYSFADPAIEKSFRNQFSKGKDAKIYKSHLLQKKRFTLTNETPKNWKDFKWMKNLRRLEIRNCGVSDLSFLREMENLQVLILTDNAITDLSIFKN